jgi:hypothetical protein
MGMFFKNKGLGTLSLVSLFLFASSGAAFGQPLGNCSCQLTGNVGGVVGNVTEASGTVLFAGTAGLVAVGVGAGLSVGDELSTGPSSSAVASFGDACQVELGANARLTVAPTAEGFCVVKVAETVATVPSGGGLGGVGAALGAGAIVVSLGLLAPVSN